VNKSTTPALAAKTRPLGVANARHGTRYVCALRLDRTRFDDLLGRAGFIYSL
jgi:hypothetical protein